MDCPNQKPWFNGSRFSHEPSPFYYPFGNTPAQNLLEYVPSGSEEPSVLLLASGDIRSCLLTIWKNFDPALKHRFHGVHFVVNDRSSAVIARNILFLYLCLNTPGNKSERRDWILAMWSIWYCHELLPAHELILQTALKALLRIFSDKAGPCSSSDHALLSLVQYNLPDTLETIKTVWKMWYNREINVTSVKNMRSTRQRICDANRRIYQINRHHKATMGTLDVCGKLGVALSSNFQIIESMVRDYQSYLESGNAFGENVFGNGPDTQQTSINRTLFERKNGEYLVHYGSCPFRCFQQTYIQSVDGMISSGMHVPRSVKDGPRVDSKAFEQAPLLANSFQQFSIWVSTTAKVLQNRHANVSFTFDVSDVFNFSQSWIESKKKQFDLIFATNVIDSVSPPAFILAAVRLLTDTGSFMLSTMRFRQLYSCVTEYIQAVFGIKSEMLPLICGIRCVNQEGLAYSSPVSPCHIPTGFSDKDAYLSDMQEKLLIWKKVSGNSLVIDSLTSHPHLSEKLAASFIANCSLNQPHNSCTDTTFEILKAFAARLCQTDLLRSHEFWEELCSRLQKTDSLKPFLTCIQTQALLKGFHFHLVVDEHTCPTCNDVPLSEYLGLFCVEVQSDSKLNYFIASLFKSKKFFNPSIVPALCPSLDQLPFTQQGALQCIDCFSVISDGLRLKLYFYAPLSFNKEGCWLTLTQCGSGSPSVMHEGHLSGYQINSPSFSLPKHWSLSESSACKHSSSLGTLTEYCGSEDEFMSKLSLIKDDFPALLTGEIQVEQISSTELAIQCLNHSIQIRYPYPISGSSIIQRSRKFGTLTVKAKREPHLYEEEGQSFHVNPEDHFSLVPYSCGPKNIEGLLMDQYTRVERIAISNTDPRFLTPPLLKVKRIFSILFIVETNYFFSLVMPEETVVGFVKIINRVIDVHRRTHAVDLCFCFLDTLDETTSKHIGEQLRLENYVTPYGLNSLFLFREAYDLLKKLFNNFASKTLQSAAKYPLSAHPPNLSRCKIDGHFRRAVVYPLYPDSVISGRELRDAVLCQCCKQLVDPENVEKCVKCKITSYCSQECRKEDWNDHKLHCKKDKPLKVNISEVCSYCNGQAGPEGLKKCLGCKSVSYCSKQCQTDHWKVEHNILCTKSHSPSSGPALLQGPPADKGCSSKQTSSKKYQEGVIEQGDQPKQPAYHEILEQCSYCHQQAPHLKHCLRCYKAQYCGRECQRAHWNKHKKDCQPKQPTDSEVLGIEECSHCHQQSQDLKHCLRCHKAQYCGRECQHAHWNKHKEECKKAA